MNKQRLARLLAELLHDAPSGLFTTVAPFRKWLIQYSQQEPMNTIDLDFSHVYPHKSLVEEWAKDIPNQGNPSLYMRECYLQYGIEQGATVMCERLRHWVANHKDELVDVDELFDQLLEGEP